MQIAGLTAAQHDDYLALVNAEIRPAHATTRACDDFPVALDAANRPWMVGATNAEGGLAAALTCLVRPFRTSCGRIPVAALGSVVTRPEYRGQGLSTRIQVAAIELLCRQKVPLAVLWSDRPEIYAGRGFIPAGVEWHADLEDADLPEQFPAGLAVRPFHHDDCVAVSDLYRQHRLHTEREPGDAARLYGMPGTQGLVAADGSDVVRAAVFCGKGADFHQYVTEWSGPPGAVLPLLAAARATGLAGHVLLPQGSEDFVKILESLGSRVAANHSGCWSVLLPGVVNAMVPAADSKLCGEPCDVRALLGSVDADGRVQTGLMDAAVWGFDSI